MRGFTILACLMVLAAVLIWRVAEAQVPPHAPGTVCYTPYFWCWAQPPGPPGLACVCPSPRGLVGGVLG
jgi:hypothetical protein